MSPGEVSQLEACSSLLYSRVLICIPRFLSLFSLVKLAPYKVTYEDLATKIVQR